MTVMSIVEQAESAAELYRAIRSKAKNDLPDLEGPISFSDLMVFINISNTSVPFRRGFINSAGRIETLQIMKKMAQIRKSSLEMSLSSYINPISKWVNFINGRRDRKKIIMRDGINFLNFMHGKVDAGVYNYLVELYSVEKILMLIKCYELEKIVYDSLDIDSVEYIAPVRYPKIRNNVPVGRNQDEDDAAFMRFNMGRQRYAPFGRRYAH